MDRCATVGRHDMKLALTNRSYSAVNSRNWSNGSNGVVRTVTPARSRPNRALRRSIETGTWVMSSTSKPAFARTCAAIPMWRSPPPIVARNWL